MRCLGAAGWASQDGGTGRSQSLRSEPVLCGSDEVLFGEQENSMETKFRVY